MGAIVTNQAVKKLLLWLLLNQQNAAVFFIFCSKKFYLWPIQQEHLDLDTPAAAIGMFIGHCDVFNGSPFPSFGAQLQLLLYDARVIQHVPH